MGGYLNIYAEDYIKENKMKQKAKNILVVRNDHIGDAVLSTPVFRELKRKFKNSRLTVITSPTTRSLLETNPHIDELLVLDLPKHTFRSLWDYIKMSWKLRKMKFDVGVDLRGSLQISFFLLWLSGIKRRIGKADNYHNKFLNWLTSIFQTEPIITNYYTNTRHITRENLFILNSLKLNINKNFPEIFVTKDDESRINNFIQEKGIKDYIAIFPLTDAPSKQWPINYFEEILKWLRQFNYDIVLVGTRKHQEDLEKMAKFNSKCRVATNFNLRELFVLFKKSKMLLAQDGGPFHIAWTAKTNTVELVRPFPPELAAGKFKALGNTKIIWSKDTDIKNIDIEEVKKAIKETLDKK